MPKKQNKQDNQDNMVNIAVVGCGMWGRNIIRNAASLGVLAGVCDRNEARAAEFAKDFDTKALDFNAAIADSAIDGIMIATSAASHELLANQALSAGKHVYIEKPMALTMQEAKAIASQAKKSGKQVMVGHLIRYHSAYIELQAQVENGAIGQLRHIQANRLAMGRIRNTESVLFDLCPHDLSLILNLTGRKPESVHCAGASHITKGLVDVLNTTLSFSGGVTAMMQTSWMSPYKEHRLTVSGSKGSLVFDDTLAWPEKLRLYQDNIQQTGELFVVERASPISLPVAETEPLKEEVRAFCHVCKTGAPATTDMAEALEVQEVLEMMTHQLKDMNHLTGSDR